MYSVHVTIREVLNIIQRRRRLLIMPAVLVTVICLVGAFVLPRKYVASTTFLIQRDEVLNPLVRYDMAISLAAENRMQAFEEIVYSRGTIQALSDSLHLGAGVITEADRQAQIRLLMGNIQIDKPGESSFRISFSGSDPVLVQQGAAFLARYSIRTMIQVENRRNDVTVQFFEEKLQEYKKKFEQSRQTLVPLLQRRIAATPLEANALSTQREKATNDIRKVDRRIQTYRQSLEILRTFPEAFRTHEGQQALLGLQREELPFVADLRPLLTRYDAYMLRYTHNYPGVIELESQILDLLKRMRTAIEYEIPEEEQRREQLKKHRSRLVAALQQTSASQRMDQDQQTNYNMYKQLYDDMKVKLEQAQTNRELRNMGKDQFVIIDPPVVPSRPTKPNRKMVVIGGSLIGIMLGIVSVVFAELFDTTIRSARDLTAYKIPVVASIPLKELDG